MSTVENPASVSRLPDADMQAAPAALVRAARQARELATRTGTSLVLGENGPAIERTVTASEEESKMTANLRELPVNERILLVEDLWDSIAAEQSALPMTDDQKLELDRRLDAYEADGLMGRVAVEAIADIRKRL